MSLQVTSSEYYPGRDERYMKNDLGCGWLCMRKFDERNSDRPRSNIACSSKNIQKGVAGHRASGFPDSRTLASLRWKLEKRHPPGMGPSLDEPSAETAEERLRRKGRTWMWTNQGAGTQLSKTEKHITRRHSNIWPRDSEKIDAERRYKMKIRK